MEAIRAIVDRFPRRELDIRRRCASDSRFRAICRDYEEAAAALSNWLYVSSDNSTRIEEYRNFLVELEAEILTQLENCQAREGS
ncbi:hypothetical protein [Microbaculum sp. FT89]|uniref:hypothetical protein n=1 Tax=Microbaculum sp. FT89 TaxID=3447298 RepID=UPI003F533FF5